MKIYLLDTGSDMLGIMSEIFYVISRLSKLTFDAVLYAAWIDTYMLDLVKFNFRRPTPLRLHH